ncbi:MAG: copper chaperone PCu(A)C [Bdellovibrionales bacterium]
MKHIFTWLFTVIILASPSLADDVSNTSKVLGIQADGLYSFATAQTQKNGVVGGDLENITAADIKIVRAESDVADRVELHTHIVEDDIMRMREVESYDVKANDRFNLGPRAEHIMLIGLKGALKQGSVFSVRLFDETGASIDVPVLVRAPGDIPDDAMPKKMRGKDKPHHEH